MLGVLRYISNKDKTTYNDMRLTTGINCNYNTGFAEMKLMKEQFKKENGRQFYQFVQSFSDKDNVSPTDVHQMGIELAEKLFPNYEVMVATHCNTTHLHNHILVNSVSFKTGQKLHQNHDTLVEQRKANDEICVAYGLNILPKYEKQRRGQALKQRELRVAKLGNSWKFQLMSTIDDCMKYAKTKERFIELMESESYKVSWSDNKKYITYTLPNGKKCRDKSLHENKYLKERMEREFEIRKELYFGRTQTAEQKNRENLFMERGEHRQYIPQSGADIQPYSKLGGTDEGTSLSTDTELLTGAGNDNGEIGEDRTDLVTGWEEERELLFKFEIQEITANSNNINTVDIADSLVRLGKNIENLDDSNNYQKTENQLKHHIDRKALKKLREKKANLEMKMY